ncbi:hypothetical protein GOE07_29660 [Sinorhizobium medicae]|nr:hypothetical protein [Sinorhizobium medicae]
MTISIAVMGISTFLAVAFPLILVLIRQTVKLHRQEVIQDLSAVFNIGGRPTAERLIPSFEFVKFKYFLPASYDGTVDRSPNDFPFWAWVAALVPFCITSGALGWFCLSIVFGEHAALGGIAISEGRVELWAIAVCAAFLGAYLAAIRGLAQAIHNFDLSPALIVAAPIDVVASIGLAVVFVKGVAEIVPDAVFESSNLAQSIVIVLAFAIGFLPDAAQRSVVNRSRLNNFKRENGEIYKFCQATPIELIDGIDTTIRDRLADFHIASTQNLATANPLLLFVETPYGVYQIMDWVAQAQLCASVGPSTMTSMWRLGVRTLFDLERAALDRRIQNVPLLQEIGKHLLGDPKDPSKTFDESAVRANIQMRLDDPHVHRLRQIYIQVGDRIGERYCRFGNGSASGPKEILSDGVTFTRPDKIIFPEAPVDIQHQDRLLIQGGPNSNRIVVVDRIDNNVVWASEAFLVDAPIDEKLRLYRLSP